MNGWNEKDVFSTHFIFFCYVFIFAYKFFVIVIHCLFENTLYEKNGKIKRIKPYNKYLQVTSSIVHRYFLYSEVLRYTVYIFVYVFLFLLLSLLCGRKCYGQWTIGRFNGEYLTV